MPRLTIRINGQPVTVYQKKDAWRGGISYFVRAERAIDDFGPRRGEWRGCKGYQQSDYLLEDDCLVVTWGDVPPETIAEITGPEPSTAWAKGTIKTTAGNEQELEYKLTPHTKEQAEKVFQERLLDATAQGQLVAAQRMAAASAAPLKALSEGLADAASVARSGLLVAHGPLVEDMDPEEREFYNRLVQKDPKTDKALSYRALAERIGCSHSAVKRRREALERKYPRLRPFIADGRQELAKGAHPEAIPATQDNGSEEDRP